VENRYRQNATSCTLVKRFPDIAGNFVELRLLFATGWFKQEDFLELKRYAVFVFAGPGVMRQQSAGNGRFHVLQQFWAPR
jgi:hypothetical protein